MGYRDEWNGTKKELIGLVEFCIDDIRKELDIWVEEDLCSKCAEKIREGEE